MATFVRTVWQRRRRRWVPPSKRVINFVLNQTIDNVTSNVQSKVLVQASVNDTANNLALSSQVKVLDNVSLNKTIDNLTLNSTSDVDVGLSLNRLIGSPTEWSQIRKGSGITVSGGDSLTATRAVATAWHSVYSTTNHLNGKFYIKFTTNEIDISQGFIVGLGNASGTSTNFLGFDSSSAGLQSNGSNWGFSGGVSQGAWAEGDELLLAFDCDNKKAYLRRNGIWIGSPALGTGFISWTFSGPYYFAWSGYGGSSVDQITASLEFDSDSELVDYKSWDDLTDFESQVLVQGQLNQLISNLSPNLQTNVLVKTQLNALLEPIVLDGVLKAVENLVLNSLIDEIDLSANAQVLVNVNLNKTIDAIVSSASATVILNINVNETLDNLTLSSTLQLVGEDRNLVVNALIDNLDLDSTVQVIINAALNSLIDNINSSVDADVINNLNLLKTIDNLTLNAVVATTTGFVLNESIGDITPSSIAKVIENLNLNQSIGLILSNLLLNIEDHLSLSQILNNLTISSTATVEANDRNLILNTNINNIISVATLTLVAQELNIVVDATIDDIELSGRLRRVTAGDNVAWWWRQYVAQHQQRKLLEREIFADIISPVGILKGEVVGVKTNRTNRTNKTDSNVIVFSGFLKSVKPDLSAEVNHGIGIDVKIITKKSKLKSEAFIGNNAQINDPINIPIPLVNGKAELLNIVNSKINSPFGNVFGLAENGYVVESKIVSNIGLVRCECEIGINISKNINIIHKTLIEINADVSHGVNNIINLSKSTIDIDSQIYNGVVGEGKIINSSLPIIDIEIAEGVVGEGKLNIVPNVNIDVNIYNGVVGEFNKIISPKGFVKSLNLINGKYANIKILSPLLTVQSKIVFGINDEIKIVSPNMKIKSDIKFFKPLALVDNLKVITPKAHINAEVLHDPDDEDMLTAVLLLAA